MMKPAGLILLCFAISNLCFGQTETASKPTPDSVDAQPLFPGGPEAMMMFIMQNLKYPRTAQRKGVEGKVFVSFVVSKDGTLRDFEVLKGISPELDTEAIRVVKLMPTWTPGKFHGNPVNVKMVLPLNFKLYDATRKKKY